MELGRLRTTSRRHVSASNAQVDERGQSEACVCNGEQSRTSPCAMQAGEQSGCNLETTRLSVWVIG